MNDLGVVDVGLERGLEHPLGEPTQKPPMPVSCTPSAWAWCSVSPPVSPGQRFASPGM